MADPTMPASGRVAVGVTVMGVDPPDEFVALARVVEQLGYDYMWVTDSSLHARCVYVYLTLLATHTSRVRFGPNCTHPYTRHPAVNVVSIAALDELSGGRAIMNIGVGGGPVAELGFRKAPVKVVREAVEAMRLLLSGAEIPEFQGEAFALRRARLQFGARKDLPVYVTASGPKMLEMAGQLADGVVYEAGVAPAGVRFALQHIERGREAAGRTAVSVDLACCIFGSVRESRADALAECRPAAAWLSTTPYGELAGLTKDQIQRIKDSYTAGHFSEAHAAGTLLSDEVVDRLVLAGPPAYWVERLAELRALGVDHFEIFPVGQDRLATVRSFGERVLPQLQRT
jgi:5,10-methylenetetrahydromethanopterin reductase